MRLLFLCNQWHVTRTPCRVVGQRPELWPARHQWVRAVGATEAMPGDLCFDASRDSLAEIAGRFPGGYPDAMVVWEPGYQALPQGIEDAPFPVVACYSDWNLVMPAQAGMLDVYDYLFTDRPGVRMLRTMGYENADYWPMWGHDPDFSRVIPGVEKIWDVGMIGNLNAIVQRGRAPWLARVGRLADRYRVRIAGGVFNEEYTRLMNATKITFNRSIRGEMNMRCYEAAASGSLLFYEEENEEIREVFEDRVHCVFYNDRNLEALIDYYLAHDEERERIVAAARARVERISFPRNLIRLADRLEALDLKAGREKRRSSRIPVPERRKRHARQAAGMMTLGSAAAAQGFAQAALAADPNDAAAHNDLAVLNTLLVGATADLDQRQQLAAQSVEHLRRAVELCPNAPFYSLNLAYLYACIGLPEAALDLAQQALALLDKGGEDTADPLCLWFPHGWDEYHVQYCILYNATRATPESFDPLRRCLLMHRGGMLLGQLAEQHGQPELATLGYRVAVAARPDLGSGRVRLAWALAGAGGLSEAVSQLEAALQTDPFLAESWILYTSLLLCLGRDQQARQFVSERLTILHGLGLSEADPALPAPGQGIGHTRALLPYLLEVLSDSGSRVSGLGSRGERPGSGCRVSGTSRPETRHPTPDPRPSAVTASIVICTSNHAESLRQTLQSLKQVAVPEGLPCELVVVDNASTDDTVAVVEAFEWEGRSVRCVREPRRGLSHARNTGLAAARGEILLFTDDDLRLPGHWIEGMCAPIISGKAHAVAGGVYCAPHLERPWMEEMHRSWLASTERLNPADPEDMVGANMAFSREVLSRVPAFDTELGAGTAIGGDDTLFSYQVKQAGYRLISAFDVAVEHHFDPSRLLRASFLGFAWMQGQMMAYLAHHWEHTPVPRLGPRLVEDLRSLADAQLRAPQDSPAGEGMPREEMLRVRDLHFYKAYRVQQQRPRNYEPYGLVKIRREEG